MHKSALLLLPLFCIAAVPALHAETLRILAWEGYTPDAALLAFKKETKQKYGVDIDFKVAYVKQFSDFYDGIRGGHYDLAAPISDIIKDDSFDLINKKLILPLNLANIPNYKTLYPDLQHPSYSTDNGQVYAVALTQGPYGLMYNSKKVKTPPTSWNVLWDQKNQQQYSVGNLPNFNVITVAISLGYKGNALLNYETLRDDPRIEARLTSLIKNSSKVWDGVDNASDLKNLSYTAGYGFSLPDLRKQGQQWQFASPVEGNVWWVDNWVISSQLANKPTLRKIAELFINHTLSAEYQANVFARGIATYPVTTTEKNKLTLAEQKFLGLDNKSFVESPRIIPQGMSRRNRNGMSLIWSNAMKAAGRSPEPAGQTVTKP
jgi:spermidine/putrescine-binding protein